MSVIIALVLAVLIHEASHAIAANYFGVHAQKLRLHPFGASINIDCTFLSGSQKILILLAGAFGNIIVALLTSCFLWLAPQLFLSLELFIMANAVPAVLNLLPIYPLDGGKILQILCKERFVKAIGFISSATFFILFIYSCICFFNIPLLLLCLVMLITINFDLKSTNYISKITKSVKINKHKIREVAVTQSMTLLEVYKLVSSRCYSKFIIVDRGNQAFYEGDFEKMLTAYSICTPLRQIKFFNKSLAI